MTAEDLATEQQRLRTTLSEVRARMLEVARRYVGASEARMGWFERARVVDDLALSIPIDGRPVAQLTWRTIPADDYSYDG